MMARSPLFGRRIHIAGSVDLDPSIASREDIARGREFVAALVKELLSEGATFVVPVDAERTRPDGYPICFDWLIWETIFRNLACRPTGAHEPLVVAVKHHKNEDQIPEAYAELWGAMRSSSLVQIESAAHWNMNSKRMEMQARHGDILIVIGGGEGVVFLANLYHQSGRHVVPLDFKVGALDAGALRLVQFGASGSNAQRLFEVSSPPSPHGWLNRIEMPRRRATADGVRDLMRLMLALRPPKAFCVRLLNPALGDFNDVQTYFDTVVQPVIEGELGYQMIVVDGGQPFDRARIDDEIFTKLHSSRAVFADITGARPNCFIELGYALGRGLPTMLLAREGTDHPFDINTYSAHHWKTIGTAEDRRRDFLRHWNAIKNRPSIVPGEPLIP